MIKPARNAAAIAFVVYCIMTSIAYNDLAAHQPRIPRPPTGITSLAPWAAFVIGFYYAIPAFVLALIVLGAVHLIVARMRRRRDTAGRTTSPSDGAKDW